MKREELAKREELPKREVSLPLELDRTDHLKEDLELHLEMNEKMPVISKINLIVDWNVLQEIVLKQRN
jgi:hypothetical protein